MNSKAKGVVALILAVAVLANVGIFTKMSYNKTHTAQETIVFRVGDTVASDHPISQALYIFEEELERISITVETLQLWSEKMLAAGVIDIEQYNALKGKQV